MGKQHKFHCRWGEVLQAQQFKIHYGNWDLFIEEFAEINQAVLRCVKSNKSLYQNKNISSYLWFMAEYMEQNIVKKIEEMQREEEEQFDVMCYVWRKPWVDAPLHVLPWYHVAHRNWFKARVTKEVMNLQTPSWNICWTEIPEKYMGNVLDSKYWKSLKIKIDLFKRLNFRNKGMFDFFKSYDLIIIL